MRRRKTPTKNRYCPRLRFSPGEDMLLVVNEDSDDPAVIRVRTQSLLTMIPVGHRPRDIAVKVF